MKAIVADPKAPGYLKFQEVEKPIPATSEALVQVACSSINLGEISPPLIYIDGWRPGWDVAGVIVQAAEDGSGPPVGSRIVGLVNSGAWSEFVAVPTNALAILPETLSFAQAATLPIAGLTAWYALECGGPLLARKVLVTGASGGVGHFACQLARLIGAHVVGIVRHTNREKFVRDLGAHDVLIGEDLQVAQELGPYHLILESVGGSSLAQALALLESNGTCVTFGISSSQKTTFDAWNFFGAGGAHLYGFLIFHEIKQKTAAWGLHHLGHMVAQGYLRPHIQEEVDWTEAHLLTQQLLSRHLIGKAVLHISE